MPKAGEQLRDGAALADIARKFSVREETLSGMPACSCARAGLRMLPSEARQN
jgi:hypothetical protein